MTSVVFAAPQLGQDQTCSGFDPLRYIGIVHQATADSHGLAEQCLRRSTPHRHHGARAFVAHRKRDADACRQTGQRPFFSAAPVTRAGSGAMPRDGPAADEGPPRSESARPRSDGLIGEASTLDATPRLVPG